ncbi:hypothetical protein OG894_00270 [Streptomyces sp. NBC_01724]|uniref:hypothetical protein n=1 Tax=unclassified Streptomyces TaxID=2593676 RepID=UPI002E372BD2|nr:hypothetical protein [Streptomyces sp. NBC_01724]WTE57306.1 hypothetical protein OG987_42280 [Streptomyces sp. NBC_01620]WTE65335.1 hypothetical protein OG784_00250 [Streptomyces sp. NBC_01617]WTI92706.1 hypothetical protein OHB17_00650 [Streptomyces sp. NBC_00724]WTE65352.1 hypothetical protein OG784_42095 [Streptomyces sp. NBC_01617]WTI92719.1 hypothetical protein OHB17_41355 [Streptomyces sp. NBC_00724]
MPIRRVFMLSWGLLPVLERKRHKAGKDRPAGRIPRRIGRMRAEALQLSHALKQERGGHTSDDATLFLIEWRGEAADHLAALQE